MAICKQTNGMRKSRCMISEHLFDSNFFPDSFCNTQLRVKPDSNVHVSLCAVTWITALCELRPYFPLIAEDETEIEGSLK